MINTDLTKNNSIDGEVKLINELSNRLCPSFGAYFSSENLSLMKMFSQKCPEAIMKQISAFTSWEYIPICLSLDDAESWLFYIQCIHTESLTPSKLKQKISKASFNIKNKKTEFKDDSLLDAKSELFYFNTSKLYFGKKNGASFRKLFESKTETELNLNSLFEKKFDNNEIAHCISIKILEFQSVYNNLMNILFNLFSWEIGNEITRLSIIFNVPVNDKLLDFCDSELNESFPSIFNTRHLLDCIKFAEYYKEQDQRMEFAQMASWPYIKIILGIGNVKKQIFIARQVLKQNISITALKKMLLDGFFDTEGADSPSAIEEPTINKSIVESTKKRKSNLSVTKEAVELINDIKSDLNRNIFKNSELLKFLKVANSL